MTSSFNVHIFGDGSGETIFLEFANNKIGIVDFGYKNFVKWLDEYIEKKEEDISIEFLCWTHPHDDHTRYLYELLDYLKEKNLIIKNFFRFPFNKLRYLSELIDIGVEQQRQIMPKLPFNYTGVAKPKYLLDLYNKISNFKHQGVIIHAERIQFLSELFKEGFLQENLSIHCIAPTEEDIEIYENIFQQVLLEKFPSEDLYPNSNKHNIISVALNIKFGANNIILGGDVENPAWVHSMAIERGKEYTCCNLSLLKAPHHGSETAYSQENWNNWGKDFHTAVTTYNKANLPRHKGLSNIMNHTKNIYVLKDIHKNLLLGDKCKLLIGKMKVQDDITTSPKATNHIKFTIYEDGKIEPEWL